MKDFEMEQKKYQIIYADPPWTYRDTQKSGGTAYMGACARYPLMKTEDIYNLPVQKITAKDAVLFLWVTSPLLKEGIPCLEAWGFKYRTVAFCWSKRTKHGKEVANMGRWTMGNIELCLLGVKGKPKRVARNIRQLVTAERKRHSEKPDEVRTRIVNLMGDLPRVELFARQKPVGWDVYGNQVEGSITL
jgi:N6-adenosine-specific RNA methylase IME4